MQAKVSKQWALRPAQEDARVMSDMQLLQQDYQLITMVHGEAIKQVSLAFSWTHLVMPSVQHCMQNI